MRKEGRDYRCVWVGDGLVTTSPVVGGGAGGDVRVRSAFFSAAGVFISFHYILHICI